MLKLHLSDQQFYCLKVRLLLDILRYLDSDAYMYGDLDHVTTGLETGLSSIQHQAILLRKGDL